MTESNIVNIPQTNSSAVAPMDPLVAMIERAARDPAIDLDRLERLLQMKERNELHSAEAAFNDAMAQVQNELTSIARDSYNPQTRSKYASYQAIDKAVRPIRTKHGISVTFDMGEPTEGIIRVWAFVSKGRHTKAFHYDSPVVTTGIKGNVMMTQTHASASAVTYARRYLMGMIFDLSTGEDDDGNGAGARIETISEYDVDGLRKSMNYASDASAEEKALCSYLKINNLEDMSIKDLERAIAAITKKKLAVLKALQEKAPEL